MQSAKRRHRPRLKDWARDGFATARRVEFEALGRLEGGDCERIVRLDHGLTPSEFARDFEATSTPVIVRGVPEREGWAAAGWSYEAFRSDPALRGLRLKCGEDDGGKTIRVSLADFTAYAKSDSMGDDSPLYVFDSGFSDRKGCDAVLGAFAPPRFCGRDDLFKLVGERRRPPYRWLLVGPERSGTCAHVDPLGTSAWNTARAPRPPSGPALGRERRRRRRTEGSESRARGARPPDAASRAQVLRGRKRWVLFEPGTSKHVAKGSRLYDARKEDDEAVNYFVDILPRVRAAYPDARRIECVQEPGETIFVPGGWWHAVINLDDTIGVTQNFASRTNFDAVWDKTRLGRKSMARKWFRTLEAHRDPDIRALHARAARRPPLPKRQRA